ncbi:Ran BP1 domain containing protein [Trichuris trichiura]|uniref:Ran BP1 domain containing protein n=1 Tax=Trichuris trichiura TaxID=36087 RepID=A0A077Z7G3_TRITR|nr:Ran BP1 domain containing protein [Trichuris trichiura]
MQTVQSVSVGLESVGSTGKVLFPKLAAAQTPPSAAVPSASVTHTDKGFFSNLPAAMPKQIASTTAAFSGIATPASTTLSQFDKTGYRDVKFGFGTTATPVARANEIPSSTQKNQSTFGTVGKDSQATTKSFPFGGVSFGIPKSMPSMPTAGPKAETKGAPTKGGEDVTDTAAVQKPFSLIQPAVLSVPLVTGAPLFSSSTAKSDVPVLRSSWPPTKAQEAAKEVPQKADQKPSTFSQPPVETTVKPNGCIPGAQLKSFIEAQKSAVSDSKPPATVGLSVEESGQASESEESEEENSTHYEPLVPLPDLVDVVTGEEEEEVIFKERAKMFRYHKELGMYKECGVGDLKLLKHPKTNKYRIVMRRDMVHKICANQLLHAEMRLRPMANCENSYCWIANDYSGDELVTALFAARFRNEQAASNFKETIEKCVAEVKLQDEEAARLSKQDKEEGEVPTPTEGKALSTTSTPLKGEEKEKVETAATKQSESSSFGKAKEGANLSFGQSVLSNTLVLERLTPRGGIFSFPKTDSKQEDSKVRTSPRLLGATTSLVQLVFQPGSTVLSTPTQEASVSEEEKKSDDDDAYDDSYEPNVTFEPIVPLPDLVDVVTGEEDSEVLFCERTRLFRVAAETKEYKERGTGNLKILKDTHTGRIRLVMRRDVILNVIANHWITADMHLNKHKTASNAYFWHCQNYFGEGDVAYETVAAKFKNEEFLRAWKEAKGCKESKLASSLSSKGKTYRRCLNCT